MKALWRLLAPALSICLAAGSFAKAGTLERARAEQGSEPRGMRLAPARSTPERMSEVVVDESALELESAQAPALGMQAHDALIPAPQSENPSNGGPRLGSPAPRPETGFAIEIARPSLAAAFFDQSAMAPVSAGSVIERLRRAETAPIGKIGSARALKRPQGVAVARDGKVYVADAGAHRIQVYKRNGSFERGLKDRECPSFHWNTAGAVAVNSRGDVYEVHSISHRIVILGSDGRLKGFLGNKDPTASNQGFHYPQGVAVDAKDNVYVADRDNGRVQKFDRDGNFVRSFGAGLKSPGSKPLVGRRNKAIRWHPVAVAIGREGNIYVLDSTNVTRVVVFAAGGRRLKSIGKGQLAVASALAVDDDGNVYVSERERVRAFAPRGALIGDYPIEDGRAEGVAVDGEGRLLVADVHKRQIHVFPGIAARQERLRAAAKAEFFVEKPVTASSLSEDQNRSVRNRFRVPLEAALGAGLGAAESIGRLAMSVGRNSAGAVLSNAAPTGAKTEFKQALQVDQREEKGLAAVGDFSAVKRVLYTSGAGGRELHVRRVAADGAIEEEPLQRIPVTTGLFEKAGIYAISPNFFRDRLEVAVQEWPGQYQVSEWNITPDGLLEQPALLQSAARHYGRQGLFHSMNFVAKLSNFLPLWLRVGFGSQGIVKVDREEEGKYRTLHEFMTNQGRLLSGAIWDSLSRSVFAMGRDGRLERWTLELVSPSSVEAIASELRKEPIRDGGGESGGKSVRDRFRMPLDAALGGEQ